MSKRKKFWIIFSVTSVLLVVLIFGAFIVVYNRLELVDRGLASPNFPYNRYSQDELNKMFPQYANMDVATTRTPEETHRMFVDKLKEGDLDGAVECCFVKSDWQEMKDGLKQVRDEDNWDIMIKDLDTDIENIMTLDTIATYSFTAVSDGGKYGHTLEFRKDANGVWLLESL